MYPDLFSIGPIQIKSYGLALAISFFLGVWLAIKRAEKNGLKSQQMIDLCFVILVGAIVGSRLFYVVYHTEEFVGHWLDAINPFQSSGDIGIAGLSMMGGIVLAVIGAMVYFIARRTEPWPMLDALAPSFFLGVGITRIGCFLNGCCYGLPTDAWCGVQFPYHHHAVWPTQLFESAAGFLMFGLILFLDRNRPFKGYTFWLAMMFYSVWRFLIDFIRYYEDSMIIFSTGNLNITRNQFLTVCLFIIALLWFIYLKRKNEQIDKKPDRESESSA